ncbi:MAG: T9SS type A sorting domain-containing protein, partial [Pricia sp.]|nr:T9SS type A sorting domain-containing protein [Pricia sp.]
PDGRGNLEYTMDFRDLYATVLAEWLCVPIPLVEQHLLDHPYAPVNLGFNCSGTDFPDIVYSNGEPTLPTSPDSEPSEPVTPNEDQLNAIVHKPFYPTETAPHIYLEMPVTAHVDIQLFNILGQRVGTIQNAIMSEGINEINIRESMPGHLSAGKYIYRIQVQDKKMSKSVMVA